MGASSADKRTVRSEEKLPCTGSEQYDPGDPCRGRTHLAAVGSETYIKIPVSPAGLPAIKALAAEGAKITATAVYTTVQGMLAALAGADYIAVYFNRIEQIGEDPERVIGNFRLFWKRVLSMRKSLRRASTVRISWSARMQRERTAQQFLRICSMRLCGHRALKRRCGILRRILK